MLNFPHVRIASLNFPVKEKFQKGLVELVGSTMLLLGEMVDKITIRVLNR